MKHKSKCNEKKMCLFTMRIFFYMEIKEENTFCSNYLSSSNLFGLL